MLKHHKNNYGCRFQRHIITIHFVCGEKIDFSISIHVGFFFLAYLKSKWYFSFFVCLRLFLLCFTFYKNNLSSWSSWKNKLYSVSNCVLRNRAIAIKNQDRQYKEKCLIAFLAIPLFSFCFQKIVLRLDFPLFPYTVVCNIK